MLTEIVKADIGTFQKYENQILDIFLDTGTSGVMEQYMDRDVERKYMMGIMKEGYGYLAFSDNQLIGLILACPLSHDKLLPDSIKQRFDILRCFYVAEMHVAKDYQRKGIGSELMEKLIVELDTDKWDNLLIRAWKTNLDAIRFYQKKGFRLDDTIEQEKTRQDGKTKFMIEKVYLFQELTKST